MFRAQAAWRSTGSPEGLAPLWMLARGYTHFLNEIKLAPATWDQLLPCNVEMKHSAMLPHAVCTMSAITISLGLPKVLPCVYKGRLCYCPTFISWHYESMGFTWHNLSPSAGFWHSSASENFPVLMSEQTNVFCDIQVRLSNYLQDKYLLIGWRTIVFNQGKIIQFMMILILYTNIRLFICIKSIFIKTSKIALTSCRLLSTPTLTGTILQFSLPSWWTAVGLWTFLIWININDGSVFIPHNFTQICIIYL